MKGEREQHQNHIKSPIVTVPETSYDIQHKNLTIKVQVISNQCRTQFKNSLFEQQSTFFYIILFLEGGIFKYLNNFDIHNTLLIL